MGALSGQMYRANFPTSLVAAARPKRLTASLFVTKANRSGRRRPPKAATNPFGLKMPSLEQRASASSCPFLAHVAGAQLQGERGCAGCRGVGRARQHRSPGLVFCLGASGRQRFCGADEIAETVAMACCFLMTVAVALNEIANVEAVGNALGEHLKVYKGLIAAMTPGERV